MAELIGFVECAHCGTEVQLKASKKSKAYYNCPDCGQFFARTPKADEALRKKARPEPGGKKEEAHGVQFLGKEKAGGKSAPAGAGGAEQKRKDFWD